MPRNGEILADSHPAAGLLPIMSPVDDVTVGNIVHVGKRSPDLARYLRIEGQLVGCVAKRFRKIGYPRLARILTPGKFHIGVGNIATIPFKGIDVVVPDGGNNSRFDRGPGLPATRRDSRELRKRRWDRGDQIRTGSEWTREDIHGGSCPMSCHHQWCDKHHSCRR